MRNPSATFDVLAANPGVWNETVARWTRSKAPQGVSLGTDSRTDLPQLDDKPPVLAQMARPRATEPTRLAVLSDIHLSTEKRGSWKLYHRTVPRLRHAVTDIASRRVDGVIVAGDVTENGNPTDLQRGTDILAPLSAPTVAVPGNHDVSNGDRDELSPAFNAITAAVPADGLPFRTSLGGIDILCLDSTRAASGAKATLSADQLDWLADAVSRADSPIVVSHHNLRGLLAATGGQSWRSSFPMRNAGAVSEVLGRGDVPLHISGHLHIPALAGTGGVRELIAPALCSYPGGYLMLDIDQMGTTVRYVPVARPPALEEGWQAACEYTLRSRMVAWMAHHQVAALPLETEHRTAV